MSKLKLLNDLEVDLGFELPNSYRKFLLNEDVKRLNGKSFPVTHIDGNKVIWRIEEFADVSDFLKFNEYRTNFNHLVEFANELDFIEYVDGETLYYIADCTNGGIVMSMKGNKVGKIYSVDNGDFGLIYLEDDIYEFLDTITDEIDNID